MKQERCKSMEYRPGDLVYVVERDESGEVDCVTGEVFLAQINDVIICTATINGSSDLDDIIDYHISETQMMGDTEVSFYPLEDCYADKEAAHVAFESESMLSGWDSDDEE